MQASIPSSCFYVIYMPLIGLLYLFIDETKKKVSKLAFSVSQSFICFELPLSVFLIDDIATSPEFALVLLLVSLLFTSRVFQPSVASHSLRGIREKEISRYLAY
jgi:hypothetical protein